MILTWQFVASSYDFPVNCNQGEQANLSGVRTNVLLLLRRSGKPGIGFY